MIEDFLHFVWEYKLFNSNALQTMDGESLAIHQFGKHNFSSGPDFSEAQITVGETKWAGSVEIHLKSSDWHRHRHSEDFAYDNVILHVVFEDDVPVLNRDNQPIPTLELKGRISATLLKNYESLKLSKSRIPCEGSLAQISGINRSSWLNRVVIERLERKTKDVELIFNQSNQDWQQTYYSLIAACLGQNNNKLPMLELARKLPFNLVSKQVDEQEELESVFLGVGRFLNPDTKHEYGFKLNRAYQFQKGKNSLVEVSQGWKTGRIRPENSPSRRVAQLSGMVQFMPRALNELITIGNFQWSKLDLRIDEHWNHHYSLEKAAHKILSANISKLLSELIDINGHAPFLFFYGQMTGDQNLMDKAIGLLESIKPESNQIIKIWEKLGFHADNALDSQALIELEQQYCSHKKCVNCNFGKWIISSL